MKSSVTCPLLLNSDCFNIIMLFWGNGVLHNLVPKPPQKNIIGTKWVFKNKLNEQGEVTRNKVRLVAQGYSQ